MQDEYPAEAYSSNTYAEEKKTLPKNFLRKRAAVVAGQAQKYKERLNNFSQYKANPRSQSIEYIPCLEEEGEITHTDIKLNNQIQRETISSIRYSTADARVM